MGKINLQRVVLGGRRAGLVLNVVDYLLYGVLLADDFNAAMQNLGLGPMGSSLIVRFVVLDFLYGIALIYLYAAIRPRFGPGPKTAVKPGETALVFPMLFDREPEVDAHPAQVRQLAVGHPGADLTGQGNEHRCDSTSGARCGYSLTSH